MPGVELLVPLLLTVCAGGWPHPTAARPRALAEGPGLTHADLVRLLHANPNRIFGLGLPAGPGRKFNTTAAWRVDQAALHSKCGWSPYHGWHLIGKAIQED
ncbi:unnamed protein product [Phytomonas sp. Hart1]|nr:unnamed protein product [Phytomonas sp. Hart1]|eukprot:CCW71702.1 unnamed protein product [Phytomonas sp. isolate Hart1]